MYADPAHTKAMSKADLDGVLDKHAALREELGASGELQGGAGLAFPEETTTVALGDGVARRTGPFHDGEVQLSAYYVLDCPSRERAERLAERILDHHVVAVEVRAVHDHA